MEELKASIKQQVDEYFNKLNNELSAQLSNTFIRTYQVLNIAESNDFNFLYLTVRQFQVDEVKTVKVERDLVDTVEENKNYEFTFEYTNNKVEDNIESIFENTTIIVVEEIDKVGLEQIQEIKC